MRSTSAEQTLRSEHASLAAVLNSTLAWAERGHGEGDANAFFESVGAMLFYVDEFPERRHHPTESNLLFPMLLSAAPQTRAVIQRLEMEHAAGEGRIRELLRLLDGWRFIGKSRRAAFVSSLAEYVRFYLQHMRTEERELLPLISSLLSSAQRAELDAAFEAARDPLIGGHHEAEYETLLRRIHEQSPTSIGLHVA